MYHFTEVPMIISGGSMLIIDPKQELLPRNKYFKRKVGVKVPLKSIRQYCPDQLSPFYDICGYSKDMDYYSGTIFRFPFQVTSGSHPKAPTRHESKKIERSEPLINSVRAKKLLIDYYEDAQSALLFLQHVSSIDFSIRGESSSQWSVNIKSRDASADDIFGTLTLSCSQRDKESSEKVWRTAIEDIESAPIGIEKPGRGAGKVTECGVAACLSDFKVSNKVFCRLPTSVKSQIPISFHASFAVTGDRQAIPFHDIRRDPLIVRWNDWLLSTCISELYLKFLKDMTSKFGESSFNYWPTRYADGSPETMSDVIARSFWEKLLDEEHSRWPVFPLIEPTLDVHNSSPLISRPGPRRKIYPSVSSELATFDLLPPAYSHKLRPLFASTCKYLVCPPSSLSHKIFNMPTSTSLKSLNETHICELFRDSRNCDRLEGFLAGIDRVDRAEALWMLLDKMVPVPDEHIKELKILDGCRVLPRLDGSLSLLTLINSNADWAFYATNEEQNLFDFAPRFFVDKEIFSILPTAAPSALLRSDAIQKPRRDPIKDIMKGSLNVRRFGLEDVAILLEQPTSPLKKANCESRDEWLKKLWIYLNRKLKAYITENKFDVEDKAVDAFFAKYNLDDQTIYRSGSGEKWQYISPRQFKTGPFIMSPSEKDHKRLCTQVPNLCLVDNACVPFSLLEKERSLNSPRSFIRMTKALRTIEKGIDTLVYKFLDLRLEANSRTVSFILLE